MTKSKTAVSAVNQSTNVLAAVVEALLTPITLLLSIYRNFDEVRGTKALKFIDGIRKSLAKHKQAEARKLRNKAKKAKAKAKAKKEKTTK